MIHDGIGRLTTCDLNAKKKKINERSSEHLHKYHFLVLIYNSFRFIASLDFSFFLLCVCVCVFSFRIFRSYFIINFQSYLMKNCLTNLRKFFARLKHERAGFFLDTRNSVALK